MQRIWICDLKQLGKRNLESVMKRYFSNDSASSMPIICKIIFLYILMISMLFLLSIVQSRPALWDPMDCSMPGFPVHHQLPEFTDTHIHRVSDAIQPSHPLSSPSSLAPNSSQHQVFSDESTLRMRWPKYWSFSFSISPSKEHPGLISFRMDWLDLLAVQRNLNSLLQHHSLKSSIFGAQLPL